MLASLTGFAENPRPQFACGLIRISNCRSRNNTAESQPRGEQDMHTRPLSGPLTIGLIAMTILLLFASSAATASHHGKGQHHKMPTFADVDLNGDGTIVASEFYEARAARMAERAKAGGKMKNAANAPTFESIDLDDDGEISAEEFAAHQAEMKAKRKQQ
jgi:hypothetical protein